MLDDVVKFGFNAGYAVMFFYVISGFLITYTLTQNYRWDWPGIAAFYSNRFIRIFSLYWAMAILALFLIASGLAAIPCGQRARQVHQRSSCSAWIGEWPLVLPGTPMGLLQ